MVQPKQHRFVGRDTSLSNEGLPALPAQAGPQQTPSLGDLDVGVLPFSNGRSRNIVVEEQHALKRFARDNGVPENDLLSGVQDVVDGHCVSFGAFALDLPRLEALHDLPQLKKLGFHLCRVGDFTPLEGHDALEALFLEQSVVSDLSTLDSFPSLTLLSLRQIWDSRKDVSLGQVDFEDLLSVMMGDRRDSVAQLSDISFLQACRALRTLDLSGNGIEDLSALQNMFELTELVLAENQIEEVTMLGRLDALTHLVLEGNLISDPAPLSSLSNLEYLDLRFNRLRNPQFEMHGGRPCKVFCAGNSR